MSDKMRVFELAKEMGYSSKVLLDILQKMGVDARSNFSVLEPPTIKRIRETVKKGDEGGDAEPEEQAPAKAAPAAEPQPSAAPAREIRRTPGGGTSMVTTIDAAKAEALSMARTGPKPKAGGEIRRIIRATPPAAAAPAAGVPGVARPPAAAGAPPAAGAARPAVPGAAPQAPGVARPAVHGAAPAAGVARPAAPPTPGTMARPAAAAGAPPAPGAVRPPTAGAVPAPPRPGMAPTGGVPTGARPAAQVGPRPGVAGQATPTAAPPARPAAGVAVPGAPAVPAARPTAPPARPPMTAAPPARPAAPGAPPPAEGSPAEAAVAQQPPAFQQPSMPPMAPPQRPVRGPAVRPTVMPTAPPARPPAAQPMRPGPQFRGGRPMHGGRHDQRRGGPGGRGPAAPVMPVKPEVELKHIELPDHISVSELASKLGITPTDIIKTLMSQGMLVTINQTITFDRAEPIAAAHGFRAALAEEHEEAAPEVEDEAALEPRPPVVTVLGHVDHGKTSLLDAIRKTSVAAGEAGGITQKIGAYTVQHGERAVTFIDTPGHEAFTAMRARGAKVTDVAVLVVAADDGVMPQTIEALNHAKAAEVPIVVAINKIDKPQANPDKVMQQLTEYELIPEAWGGSTVMQPVSAKQGTGLDDLLEMILLVADLRELKANPNRKAFGIVIESKLDKGLGPVATVLVQQGTLKVGDAVVVGNTYGRVRNLINDRGDKIRKAGPAIPAEIIGLSGVPDAGDSLQVVDDEKMARQIVEQRQFRAREKGMGPMSRTTLEDFMTKMQAGEVKDLNLIVKADGQGSVEALKAVLARLTTQEVRVNVIHGGVGSINESDILLATASSAIIIGFNVRPDPNTKRLAEQEGVDIRTYRVIYHVTEDIQNAMKGMLAPEFQEVQLGRVEIRKVFKVSKIGSVAGCYVLDGKIVRNSDIRLLRDNVVVYEGKIDSLKRFKDDAREVLAGYECGLTVEKYNDIREGDIIEVFKMEEKPRE